MIQITKRVDFSASHRLFNPEWDFDKNEEVFDKCNNPNGHGHNYILEVTVRGTPDPETGYVIDLKKLKFLVDEAPNGEDTLYSIQYDDDLVFCRLGVDTIGNTTDECNLQSFVHGGDLESMCDTGAVL